MHVAARFEGFARELAVKSVVLDAACGTGLVRLEDAHARVEVGEPVASLLVSASVPAHDRD